MNPTIVRRSTRLLNAVLQLHKEGYQDLAILSGRSANGFHWRCELHSYENLALEDGKIVVLDSERTDIAYHSSGDSGNEYFGWKDCQNATARELADSILERFPTLLSTCRRENHEYSGWLVSTVGFGESGKLPILFSDCGEEHRPDLAGSLAYNPPPLQPILHIGGKRSLLTRPPHLKPDDDWHTAYIGIIEAWRASSIRRLPSYPGRSGSLYEHGAYWEGAIWYIQEILGFTSIQEFLEDLRSPQVDSERWATFFAIWNSEGQLEFLEAFLIRQLISGKTCQQFDRSKMDEYERHLRLFEARHRHNGLNIPNPYFGGSNPLHLGMILLESPKDERLR